MKIILHKKRDLSPQSCNVEMTVSGQCDDRRSCYPEGGPHKNEDHIREKS